MGTPGPIKKLREFYKEKQIPNVQKFLRELNDESDRAVVIIMTTMIDDELQFRLVRSMDNPPKGDDEADRLFGPNGILYSFSSRIRVAHAFGETTSTQNAQLDDLREMRNACAHSKHGISFATQELAAVASRFLAHRSQIAPKGPAPANIRFAFVDECGKLLMDLRADVYRRMLAAAIRVAPRKGK